MKFSVSSVVVVVVVFIIRIGILFCFICCCCFVSVCGVSFGQRYNGFWQPVKNCKIHFCISWKKKHFTVRHSPYCHCSVLIIQLVYHFYVRRIWTFPSSSIPGHRNIFFSVFTSDRVCVCVCSVAANIYTYIHWQFINARWKMPLYCIYVSIEIVFTFIFYTIYNTVFYIYGRVSYHLI